jgi:23S rRNA (uracil1939-C5)-methyltransferase
MFSEVRSPVDEIAQRWQQGQLVEVAITDLSDGGDGVCRYAQRAVFVPDTVTGDRALVRLVQVKKQFALGQLVNLLQPSPHRIRPHCIVADRCGGCQWQHVTYDYQQQAKREQVVQALVRIGGFESPPVRPMLPVDHPLGYRNKATFPLGRSGTGQVKAGYYRKGSHRLVNLNRCPVQDEQLDPMLAELKQDIQDRGWSIYDEQKHQGKLRHMSLRIGRRTGQVLLTLISASRELTGLEAQAQVWQDRYPDLMGVCLNENTAKTNVIFGARTDCIAGQPYIEEVFAGLRFQIRPETFFQVHTEQAEALLQVMVQQLQLTGDELLLDAYCGVGTLTLPLAKRVRQTIGIEAQVQAVEQARQNAQANGIANVEFRTGTVESVLPGLELSPDVVLLDPPRKGCDRRVIETLLQQRPKKIAYMSCKAATLARDLQLLCETGQYRLVMVQPADFFPQTSHVEAAAFLERVN